MELSHVSTHEQYGQWLSKLSRTIWTYSLLLTLTAVSLEIDLLSS